MKQAMLTIMVLVLLATTSCTDIMGIDLDTEYQLRGRCNEQPRPVSDEMQGGANYVAVDAMNLYWTNRDDGRVMKMAIDTLSITKLAGGQDEPRCITVDATHVYWTNRSIADMPNTGKVMRIKIDGTEKIPTELAKAQNNPYDIFVTDEFIFWTNEGTTPPKPPDPAKNDGSIMKLALPKGSTIAAPTIFIPELTYPQAIAVAGDDVYWTDIDYVMRTDRDGKTRIQIAPLPPSPYLYEQLSDLAVTGNSLFWTDTDNNKVHKAGTDGSGPKQLASNSQTPFGIAVDRTYVYWTTPVSDPIKKVGTINKVGINGGIVDTIAWDQAFPVGIAVDETCVYWANRNDGTVMKRAK